MVVSSEIGTRLPQQHMSGTVEKLMKKLTRKSTTFAPDFKAVIKRQAMFSCRSGLENTHFERDEDIIEQAIREFMQ